MRKRAERLFPVLLLTGLSLYYLFRPTGEHAPLLNGISPAVEWVSIHESPGRRYDELLALPWVADLLEMFGVETDAGTRFWIRELFPREVLLAREGGMGIDFSPGWVMISRISGRQTRLRLMLDLFGLDGYERTGKHNGNVLWTLFEEGQTPITVTLANGKLIFVAHHDPQAIRDVLDRLEGRRHRFAQFRSLPEELLPDTESPDRGFWLGNGMFPEPLAAVSDFARKDGAALHLQGPGVRWLTEDNPEENHQFAARLGGPSTLAMLRLPVLSGVTDRPAHLLLVGDGFRTPLALVNLPTLVLLQDAETPGEANRLAREWMAELSHWTGMSWSTVGTRDGLGFLPEDRMLRRMTGSAHRPAARHREGRLLFSSSEVILDRLEARLGEPASEFELRDVAWRGEHTFFWVSGARAAADLRGLFTVLGFFGHVQSHPDRATRLFERLPRFEVMGGGTGDQAAFRLLYDPSI
jgi:hypothetical protein